MDVLTRELDQIGGRRADTSFTYTGNQPIGARLTINGGRPLEAVCLPGSPAGSQQELELVDLGGGSQQEFETCPTDLSDKALIVRHEYPFSLQHTHRWRKYEMSVRAGAAAFIIANNIPRIGPVTGGIKTPQEGSIPAVGVSYEDGEALAAAARKGNTIQLIVESTTQTWTPRNLILDIPGREDKYVVLCAHIDGHNLAESAMDNATGLAATLEIGRVLAPIIGKLRYGLRLALFSVEEWGISGSKHYVESLSTEERDKIVCAIALDSITGHPRLSALTGGYASMERLVREYETLSGSTLDIIRPQLPNSDHISFQENGIPAMRIIAGYGNVDSMTRYLLTPADRRENVEVGELKAAASIIAGLVYMACEPSA